MSVKYLEFDSTYRNRNEWPEPAEFDLIMSQTGKKDKLTAVDPVCLSAPVLSWLSTDFDANAHVGTVSVTLDADASSTTVLVGNNANLQTTNGYYNGAVISNGTNISRVIDYKYISGGNAVITISPAFATIPANATITDPTTLSASAPYIFVPHGSDGNNAYNGMYLYNETASAAVVTSPQQDYRAINFYDATTKLVSVDTTNTVGTWTGNDTYSIRSEIPVIVATISSATLTSAILTSPPTRGSFSSTTNFYKGDFIRIRSSNEYRRIVSYDGTNMFTVSPAFSSVPSGVVEILSYSYDNFNPFVYTGSQVSQQQDVCYELELLDLVLPNQILDSEQGSRISFYPYVYVELTNLSSASANNKNILYSNNPNSTNMLWRVAIDDISNQVSSAFIKNDCDGSKQTVKFKPNDNLHFSVRLSNGELFKTELTETYSPLKPNPLLQISGLFSVKRL